MPSFRLILARARRRRREIWAMEDNEGRTIRVFDFFLVLGLKLCSNTPEILLSQCFFQNKRVLQKFVKKWYQKIGLFWWQKFWDTNIVLYLFHELLEVPSYM